MLLQLRKWNEIRGRFTESEKAEINAAIIGETSCIVLGEDKLSTELYEKLTAEIGQKESK